MAQLLSSCKDLDVLEANLMDGQEDLGTGALLSCHYRHSYGQPHDQLEQMLEDV